MQPIYSHVAHVVKERVEGNIYLIKITGVDYLRPFEFIVFRRSVKHRCCSIRCLVNGAVHIEVAKGVNTHFGMMEINRFMARSGRPHKIVSDNGKNFVRASRKFKECFKKSFSPNAVCEWLAHGTNSEKLIFSGFSRFGRISERLVRSCKKAMYAILGNQRLTLPMFTKTM